MTMIERAGVAVVNEWHKRPDCPGDMYQREGEALGRVALLAALDPPREEIYALSEDSAVSFELVCSVLMALRRASLAQGD